MMYNTDEFTDFEMCTAYGVTENFGTEFNGLGVVDTYCLFYVLSGQGVVIIDGRSYSVGERQSCLVFPYSRLEMKANGTRPWSFRWVKFRGYEAPKIIEKTLFGKDTPIVGEIPVNNFEEKFRIGTLHGRPYEIVRSNSRLMMLMSYYLEHYPADIESKANYAMRATEYIERNYKNPDCSVRSLSEYMNLDRTYLYRLFKEKTGMSMIDYINRRRISNAEELLRRRDMSVKDIAFSVGYTDQMYFSRVFKRITGMSPTEYRNSSKLEGSDFL